MSVKIRPPSSKNPAPIRPTKLQLVRMVLAFWPIAQRPMRLVHVSRIKGGSELVNPLSGRELRALAPA